MIFVPIIGSLCWSSGRWWWSHIRDRRFRVVFRPLNSWIHIHIERHNLGRWKIPWQRKTTWSYPPFQLMDMIINVIYGVPGQERRYPYFTKKSPDFSHQGLPGLAWREEKKCKSTPYNGQYSNIWKSTVYKGQYLLHHHYNRDPSRRRQISVKDTVVHSTYFNDYEV